MVGHSLPYGMSQLKTVGIEEADGCLRDQESVRPRLTILKTAKESRAFRQQRKHVLVVGAEPQVEGPLSDTLDGIEQAYIVTSSLGNSHTWLLIGYVFHRVVYPAKQLGDKNYNGHGGSSSCICQLTE